MAGSLKSRESGPFTPSMIAAGNVSAGGPSRLIRDRGELDERVVVARGRDTFANPTDSQLKTDGWEIRLSLGQLVVLWSVVAGTMLMVFLFGLYAGRDQGVQAALEGSSGEAMRLPISNDLNELKSDQNPIAAIADAKPSAAVELKPSEPKSGAPIQDPAVALVPAPVNPDLSLAGLGSLPERAATKNENPSLADVKVPAANNLEKEAKLAPVPSGLAATPAETIAERIIAKPEKEKGEAPKTVRAGSLSSGWYLQVAAARTGKEATSIGRKLKAANLSPIIESAEVKGSAYYRVVLGPYSTKDAAWAMRKAALASSAARGEPFLKQVK